MKLISIVVPVYNEEVNIRHFYEAIREVMEPLPYTFELIFVDDGSTDSSREILHALEQEDERVQPIFLARNSGHQLALTCGLDYADGDAVIMMDGDMQHPPEMIPTFFTFKPLSPMMDQSASHGRFSSKNSAISSTLHWRLS